MLGDRDIRIWKEQEIRGGKKKALPAGPMGSISLALKETCQSKAQCRAGVTTYPPPCQCHVQLCISMYFCRESWSRGMALDTKLNYFKVSLFFFSKGGKEKYLRQEGEEIALRSIHVQANDFPLHSSILLWRSAVLLNWDCLFSSFWIKQEYLLRDLISLLDLFITSTVLKNLPFPSYPSSLIFRLLVEQ